LNNGGGIAFSIPNVGNPQITGSYTEGVRVALSGISPNAGTSDSPYNRINPAAFLPPPVGSIGLDSPRNVVRGPGQNNWNMSLDNRISIKEGFNLDLRVDAFNVFNHTQFNGVKLHNQLHKPDQSDADQSTLQLTGTVDEPVWIWFGERSVSTENFASHGPLFLLMCNGSARD